MNHPAKEGYYWVRAKNTGNQPFIAHLTNAYRGFYPAGTWVMKGLHWGEYDAVSARSCEFDWEPIETPPEFECPR